MKRGAIPLAAAPLALALAALAVRQATRVEPIAAEPRFAAREFTPPAIFLAAARAPGVAQTFQVDAGTGSAMGTVLGGAQRPADQPYRVSGRMSVDAAESVVALELAFEPDPAPATAPWSALGRITLRGESSACRTTAAPGTRACTLRATWTAAGTAHAELLDATWIRLPGGIVRLQAALPLEPASHVSGIARAWRSGDDARAWLAFDLSLVPSP